ncbi:MAG: hypothetical protein JXA04_09995 [Gammaproteobacteria bacterium]|nr:hypothetical protein [Gammaproteobacteria bacterium]
MGQNFQICFVDMARYTEAYSDFVRRLNEVEALRRIASEKQRKEPVDLMHEINALCRGSVVLLSSHVEAYVKDVGELALESLYAKKVSRKNIKSQFFYHISKDYLDELKNASEPAKIAEKVFLFLQEDAIYWNHSGPWTQAIQTDRFNRGFSNPAFKKIKTYFNRFGYSCYRGDLAAKLKADFNPITNMIDHLVDTRNKIAHGDPMASKTPIEIRDMISMIKRFCEVTDTVFATWWKSNFCGIR